MASCATSTSTASDSRSARPGCRSWPGPSSSTCSPGTRGPGRTRPPAMPPARRRRFTRRWERSASAPARPSPRPAAGSHAQVAWGSPARPRAPRPSRRSWSPTASAGSGTTSAMSGPRRWRRGRAGRPRDRVRRERAGSCPGRPGRGGRRGDRGPGDLAGRAGGRPRQPRSMMALARGLDRPPISEVSMPDQFAAVDDLAEGFQRRGGQPGVAYGIVAGGRLVHSGGWGERWLGGPTPDAGTVFRIASMTKSFTAAAVLALRDDGRLALDDPAEEFVPELRGLALPSPDSPRVSLRHLLTMTAGFPTDDPWGDRQQGLPLAEFSAFLARGLSFAWAPGTRFEYSNLGYAILGRVVTAATGQPYPEFVRDRLLRPLGLTSSGFEAAEFDTRQLARGYRHGPGGWDELAPDGCGAFAPMGGVFSSVTDLARWVSGFTGAFPPGEPGTGDAHPARGRITSHSGGYPGFGSNMRWHPETGIGVIVLANSTYAAASTLAADLLDAARRRTGRPPRAT